MWFRASETFGMNEGDEQVGGERKRHGRSDDEFGHGAPHAVAAQRA